MSDNYSSNFGAVKNFIDETTRAASTAGDHIVAIQKAVNGYSVGAGPVFTSASSMNDADLRSKLVDLQLQIDCIHDTIKEIKTLCNMMRDILEKEGLLSSEWQKDAQPAIDEFKNLEGVL